MNNVASFGHTGTGASTAIFRPIAMRPFNFSISGDGVGTVKIEKSYDNGSTYLDVSKDANGTVASYVKATGDEINVVLYEPEAGVLYRTNCTAFTSGTLTTRMGQ